MARNGIERDDEGREKISGSIEYVKYYNDENGYAICDLGTEDDDIITVVGTLPYIAEGDTVIVYGTWVHNPKYGRQFQVEHFEKSLPSDEAAILRYLSSGSIKGIGAKTARKIVDMFGIDTLDVIENHPTWLAQINGISIKKATEISEDFKEKSGIRSAMMFFRDFFGAATTVKIYKRWGGAAVDIAKQNPYRLCDEIDGIGFEKADSMAVSLGYDREASNRLSSGICYMLRSNAAQNGHTCLPFDKLVAGATQLLNAPTDKIRTVTEDMISNGTLKSLSYGGEQYIYDSAMYKYEKKIASQLDFLDKTFLRVDKADITGFIAREEIKSGIKYADFQKKAIADALDNGVMILTGGPGTGKTTVVRALIDIFKSIDMRVALAAPTGRAAKRMSEATSYEAKTIHRLLEVEFKSEDSDYTGLHFRKNEDDRLEEDVIIIDEASMVDCPLMAALLRAVKPGARFIFIGDSSQLPSVGPGNVLHDIIQSEKYATVQLTEIFRQARESLIITNAHAINDGQMPVLDVKNNDFFFIPRKGDAEIARTIADLYEHRLPNAYGELAKYGTQVISPSRRGEAGTENLNRLLQALHNPPSPKKREHIYRDTTFREGDRVMQIRNNYEVEWDNEMTGKPGMGIFNGDIGEIREIDKSNSRMEILFDDKVVEYQFDMLDELELAYAVTVHKSQGSEYPIVIIPAYHAPVVLLSRNLFYTAVTRAQKMVIIVGESEIVKLMVDNKRQSLRYTGLCYMIKRGI